MKRDWYTPLVILFWAASTGWLVHSKILPAWRPGEPPPSQEVHLAGGRPAPVAWTLLVDDEAVGWSISRATRHADGAMDVESLLHLEGLPVGGFLPPWSRFLLGGSVTPETTLTLEARGRMAIDAAGRPASFASTVEFPDDGRIDLTGEVHGGEVAIVVRAGDMRYETKRALPDGLVLRDELSPNATLPGLAPGRTWTVPVYGPLRPGGAPVEFLHAEVGTPTTIVHGGRPVIVDVVAYRDDPTSSRDPRATLWVDADGRVLRQEATTLGRRLVFERRDDAEAVRLASATMAGPDEAVGESAP